MDESKKIKILFVGDNTWPMYVNAFYNGARNIDYIEPYLLDLGELNEIKSKNIISRFENKTSFGILVHQFNSRLEKKVKLEKYDILFLYSVRIVYPRTIRSIKQLGTKIILYCNDNPFSDYYPSYFWRHLKKDCQYCDIVYSYRYADIKMYKEYGATNVRLLRSYYIKNRNYKINDKKSTTYYVPKVVFLGHMENDERADYIDALLEQGIGIGVRDTIEWRKFAEDRTGVRVFEETVDNYNEILNCAEIGIVFLSKINRDTYTRRCFEIPITGTMMLAPYTEDLASLFKEGEEAVFYRDKVDFVNKVKFYLINDSERERIGEAGRKRVLADGHSEIDRLNQIIKDLKYKEI